MCIRDSADRERDRALARVAGIAQHERAGRMSAAMPPTVPPLRPTLRQRAFSERTVRTLKRRRIVSGFMLVVLIGAAVLAVLPLIFIFGHLLTLGLSSLSWDFFTKMPKPVGEAGGGLANAIVGTLILIGLASCVAIPVGLVSGIYLSEYPKSRLATAVRFTADVLNGIPSIVIGIFAYALVVLPVKRFSALAGGVALGFMMIPIITRTTEELLNLVPQTLREGALALGATRSRAAFTVMVPAALPGIITGILVSLARIAGETAPL